MQIGLSTYSFPWAFGVNGFDPPQKFGGTQLLEYAAEQNIRIVQFGDNYPLHELPADKLSFLLHTADKLNIQFTEGFLGSDFLQKPELYNINQLIKKARRGLSFDARAINSVSSILLEMPGLNETRKLLALLDVLSTLSEAEGYQYLTPKDYAFDHTQDEDRMHSVNRYVYEHFSERISIRDIAMIANMTESSFCRYFKTRTLKSFTKFLNEVRISYACKLLNNDSYSVTDACFESGFTNLSYFNRQFKSIMKMTP